MSSSEESSEESEEESFEDEKLFNAELMKSADQDKINSAISEQIALVGSRSIYERINKNFKEQRFEALFAKVNYDLIIYDMELNFISLLGTLRPVLVERKVFPQTVWFVPSSSPSWRPHLLLVHIAKVISRTATSLLLRHYSLSGIHKSLILLINNQ